MAQKLLYRAKIGCKKKNTFSLAFTSYSEANLGNILKKVFFRKNQKNAKKNEISTRFRVRALKTGKNPKVQKKHYLSVLIFRKTRFT